MFENVFGRLINGAIWGAGAGLALSIIQAGGTGLRPVAKNLVKAYVSTSDRVQEMTAEARETLEDLYAEVQSEREQESAPPRKPRPIPVRRHNTAKG
jgi:DNA replicative helicase MCM subunit Mcm2 (Cdc46/Mcm family)